jgi:sugar lactone lactonase YvrE
MATGMNTRTAVATVALACLNLTAIALQEESDPVPFPAGELLIASAGSGAVSAYDEGGGTLPQPVTGLSSPQGLAFAPDGTLFVSDADSNLVLVTDASGSVLGTLGGDSPLADPAGLAFGPDGSLHVASAGTDSVLVFGRDGAFAGEIGAEDGLSEPWGLALGLDARLRVASRGTDRIAVFDASGALVDELDAAGALDAPLGLCLDGDGLLWVASSGNDTVLALDGEGAVVHAFDGDGMLDAPCDLAFGPDGLLYVSSSGSDRVLALDAAGHVARTIGEDGGAAGPRGLAFAPFLFKATLKARLQRPGEPVAHVSAKAIVSYAPGRPDLGVRLKDPLGPLAVAWDSDTWVLHGALARSADGKLLRLGATQSGAAAALQGTSAVHLRLKGRQELVPAMPALPARFRLKGAKGDFQRSGPNGIATGRLRTGAAIKP